MILPLEVPTKNYNLSRSISSIGVYFKRQFSKKKTFLLSIAAVGIYNTY